MKKIIVLIIIFMISLLVNGCTSDKNNIIEVKPILDFSFTNYNLTIEPEETIQIKIPLISQINDLNDIKSEKPNIEILSLIGENTDLISVEVSDINMGRYIDKQKSNLNKTYSLTDIVLDFTNNKLISDNNSTVINKIRFKVDENEYDIPVFINFEFSKGHLESTIVNEYDNQNNSSILIDIYETSLYYKVNSIEIENNLYLDMNTVEYSYIDIKNPNDILNPQYISWNMTEQTIDMPLDGALRIKLNKKYDHSERIYLYSSYIVNLNLSSDTNELTKDVNIFLNPSFLLVMKMYEEYE